MTYEVCACERDEVENKPEQNPTVNVILESTNHDT